jgi:hypothetical protein
MNYLDWAGLAVTIITIISALAGGVRWLVKHYLAELKPNGGTSLRDEVNRLSSKLDRLYEILIQK